MSTSTPSSAPEIQKKQTDVQEVSNKTPKQVANKTKAGTREVKADVVNTKYKKQVENMGTNKELFTELKPEFDEYLTNNLPKTLSANELNIVTLTLWNEVMKIDIDSHFGEIGSILFGGIKNLISNEEAKQKGETNTDVNLNEIVDKVEDKFDKVLKEPIEKITQYKDNEKNKDFENINDVTNVIGGKEYSSEANFDKELLQNQEKFIKRIEGKGEEGVTALGQNIIDTINKSGPIKKFIVPKIEFFMDLLKSIPLIGPVIAGTLVGSSFLKELNKEYNPIENWVSSMVENISQLPEKGFEKIKRIFSSDAKEPSDKLKEKGMKNMEEQAEKADINIKKEDNFWDKVFQAKDGAVDYYGQAKAYIMDGLGEIKNPSEFMKEKIVTFTFDPKKSETPATETKNV